MKDPLRPEDPLRARRDPRRRRVGARRRSSRRGRRAARSWICSTSPQRVDPRRVNKGVFEALVQCGAFDASLAHARGHPAGAGVRRHRSGRSSARAARARIASADRRDDRPVRDGRARERRRDGSTSTRWPRTGICARRSTREKQSLGFYVSGHPLDRYGTDLGRFDVVPRERARRHGSVVEGAGRRDGRGLPRAHLQGRRRQGRVLHARGSRAGASRSRSAQKQIETLRARAHERRAGRSISGKVSFPMTDENEEAEAAPREPTLLLDEARLLVDAIKRGHEERGDPRCTSGRRKARAPRSSSARCCGRAPAAARCSS